MTRGFTVALGLALIVVTVWWQLAEKRARHEHDRAETALAQLAAVHAIPRREPAPAGGERAGDPRVLADLVRHPELIPYPGVAGGTMRFWPGQSRVLSPRWVYAYFEDGHVSGHALLEFTRRADGTIAWRRLAAAED